MLQPVILSGGAGTRLWPLSTTARPKQFLPLVDDRPMIAATIERVDGWDDCARPIVVCGVEHAGLVGAEVPSARVILEPEGRNTAPAIALAALAVNPDDVLIVLPSDHVIADRSAFTTAVEHAVEAARDGGLVAFGIVPSSPATGFGYIRPGEPLDGYRVLDEFVEKPDAVSAVDYVDQGYLWNSGMFVFKAGRFLEELGRYRPTMLEAVREAWTGEGVDPVAWAAVPSESVDYAVMEPTEAAFVVALDAGWSDVGSWDALAGLTPTDERGSSLVGDVIAENVGDSYIRTTGPTIAVSGVENLIVVATDDAVLIVPRGESERVKELQRRVLEND